MARPEINREGQLEQRGGLLVREAKPTRGQHLGIGCDELDLSDELDLMAVGLHVFIRMLVGGGFAGTI